MANRRMFSKTITNSSKFLMMPATSRLLYYDLGMNADDDGFCEHFTVMRMTDAKPDDLKILQARGFVRVFDDRVLVITDWKENNYLRGDRYTPSKYLEEYKEQLALLSDETPRLSSGSHLVYQVATQDRIGKVRKERTQRDEPSAPFDFKEYLGRMHEDKQRHIQIIAFYLQEKGIAFESQEQVRAAIKRHVRAARDLVGFSDEDIVKAAKIAAREYPSWTVETLLKVLTR